jgi:hypothetical protein
MAFGVPLHQACGFHVSQPALHGLGGHVLIVREDGPGKALGEEGLSAFVVGFVVEADKEDPGTHGDAGESGLLPPVGLD